MSRCLMPGCTADAKPKGDYCKDAHRASAHKLRVKSGGMLPRERKRLHDAAAKRVARAQGTIPSDVRLSYARARQVLADWLRRDDPFLFPSDEIADVQADYILRGALPESKRGEA